MEWFLGALIYLGAVSLGAVAVMAAIAIVNHLAAKRDEDERQRMVDRAHG